MIKKVVIIRTNQIFKHENQLLFLKDIIQKVIAILLL